MQFSSKVRWGAFWLGTIFGIGGIFIAWLFQYRLVGAVIAVVGFLLLKFSGVIARGEQMVSVWKYFSREKE